MIWLWIHLITWIILAVMIFLTLFTNSHTKIYEMISRFGYLVLIITGLKLAIRAWSVEPGLIILKIIIALIFIALTEIAFAKKEQQNINQILIWLVIILCILVAIIGFALAGWYPFVH